MSVNISCYTCVCVCYADTLDFKIGFLCCSIRQYALTVHEDLTLDQLFTGEPTRLHSLKSQKPLVSYIAS